MTANGILVTPSAHTNVPLSEKGGRSDDREEEDELLLLLLAFFLDRAPRAFGRTVAEEEANFRVTPTPEGGRDDDDDDELELDAAATPPLAS